MERSWCASFGKSSLFLQRNPFCFSDRFDRTDVLQTQASVTTSTEPGDTFAVHRIVLVCCWLGGVLLLIVATFALSCLFFYVHLAFIRSLAFTLCVYRAKSAISAHLYSCQDHLPTAVCRASAPGRSYESLVIAKIIVFSKRTSIMSSRINSCHDKLPTLPQMNSAVEIVNPRVKWKLEVNYKHP